MAAALTACSVAASAAGYGGRGGRNGGTQPQNQAGQNQGPAQNPATGPGAEGGPGGTAVQSDPLAQTMAAPKEATAKDLPPEADPVPKLSLEDAADDFKTVVESFVLKNSVDGVWSYKDKKTKAHLTFVSVDAAGVRAAGKGLYTGDAVARDLRTKKLRHFQFKVDLSGTDWKVVSVRPSPPPSS